MCAYVEGQDLCYQEMSSLFEQRRRYNKNQYANNYIFFELRALPFWGITKLTLSTKEPHLKLYSRQWEEEKDFMSLFSF